MILHEQIEHKISSVKKKKKQCPTKTPRSIFFSKTKKKKKKQYDKNASKRATTARCNQKFTMPSDGSTPVLSPWVMTAG